MHVMLFAQASSVRSSTRMTKYAAAEWSTRARRAATGVTIGWSSGCAQLMLRSERELGKKCITYFDAYLY